MPNIIILFAHLIIALNLRYRFIIYKNCIETLVAVYIRVFDEKTNLREGAKHIFGRNELWRGVLKNCLSIWAIFRGGRSWFRGGRTPKIFRASRDNLFRASRDTHFRALRDFLGGGEADLGGGEPQNFFRASREIFFRATRETNLGLRPPLKNLQEISPPPRKNPDYALASWTYNSKHMIISHNTDTKACHLLGRGVGATPAIINEIYSAKWG